MGYAIYQMNGLVYRRGSL